MLNKISKWALILVIAVSAIASCNTSPVEEIRYIYIADSTSEQSKIIIANLQRELDITRDSLNYIKDSIGEDLFVARYKLGRIKYYVDIAEKGNNIKYLRGWCYRVLNDEK